MGKQIENCGITVNWMWKITLLFTHVLKLSHQNRITYFEEFVKNVCSENFQNEKTNESRILPHISV